MVEWDLNEDDEDGSPSTIRGRARANLPILALGFMLASAVSVAALGGAVATGFGETPYDGPTGFAFSVDRGGDTAAIVITHEDGPVPNADRVSVVDDAGTEVPWTELETDPGVAEVTGSSAVACPSQGTTITVVYEGQRATETVDSYEVTAPIPASVVERCQAAG
ncbi:hypothetical protein HUG10_18100 [Halorarum halophilum]|uniref:Uncharacterized protein n=1 Tax=Halorarum halophilum TaxID=2743090 RepID=A0A7D5GDU4_9EURY|nr:hypothetical protein [Halobaculum halophilum]QLG29326.1 hypothetical protein HUG10_18100 [Halobaculum halophilum]